MPSSSSAMRLGGNMTEQKKPTGLDLLRVPFPDHHVSKLPKPTKAQTDAVRNDFKKGIRCKICGAWHHPEVVHLDYVGHAALTDRLLDADPNWNWEPVTETGLPSLDQNKGMWIKLTVCGVTRLGYGHAEGKQGGDAIKEVIGDALRNAAMRFGAALDLWHKGDLHGPDDDAPNEPAPKAQQPAPKAPPHPTVVDIAKQSLLNAANLDQLKAIFTGLPPDVRAMDAVIDAKDLRKAELTDAPAPNADLGSDQIPY